MRSTTLRPALTAGVCLVAFGLGAATIADPTDAAATAGFGFSAQLSLPVSSTLVMGVLGVVALVLATAVYFLGDSNASDMAVGNAIPLLAGILVLGTVVAGLLLASGGDGGVAEESLDGIEGVSPDVGVEDTAEDAEAEEGGGGSPLATIGLIGLLAIGAVGGLVYWLRRDDGDEPTEQVAFEEDDEEDTKIGEAAGEAADRIEETPTSFENEVYTAWTEMVDIVDLRDPETSTPREFASAAVDAGMDREHVDRLRNVFEEVRYGERSVTPEREQEAVDALREIERAYGGESE